MQTLGEKEQEERRGRRGLEWSLKYKERLIFDLSP